MKHSNISIFIPHNGCPCQCSFCNQHRITGKAKQPTANEVSEIIDSAASYMGERVKNSEIAFFGGSFTAINREYMVSLLNAAHEKVKAYGFLGVRVSTRPDKIDDEILCLLKEYSVTAIELGAQSMDNDVLLKNKRGHSKEDVAIASKLISKYGFELGLQMMTGLYGSSDEKDIKTANDIAMLSPKTVRIYPTVCIENTMLADLYKSGEYKPQTVEEAVKLSVKLIPIFEEKGIKIIRLGLHASEDISENMLSGPYHPSFRELCQSKIYLDEITKVFTASYSKGEYLVEVPQKQLSAYIGNKKSNLVALENIGYKVKFIPCDTDEFTIKSSYPN